MSDIAKMIAIAKKFGGGSSTPAPVVILPEAEMTKSDDDFYIITSPWSVELVDGGMYVVTYNGVAYECEGVFVEVEGERGVTLGNLALVGGEGGNPDAPFVFVSYPNASDTATQSGIYGVFLPTDNPTTITLSIVQIVEASADSGNGTSDFIVTGMLNTTTFSVSNVSKTYDEVHAAAEERKNIKLYLDVQVQGSYVVMPLTQMTPTVLVFGSIISEGARWRAQYTADGMTVKVG